VYEISGKCYNLFKDKFEMNKLGGAKRVHGMGISMNRSKR